MNKFLLPSLFLALSGAIATGDYSAAAAATPLYNTYNNAKAFAPTATIFSADLSEATAMGEWTALDANADASTFGIVEGVAGITYDSDKATANTDDWLFSPAITLTAGQDYIVSYTVRRQGAFDPDDLELWAGTAATAEGMTLKLGALQVSVNAESVEGTIRLHCTESGTWHVGFHLNTPGTENGQFSILSMKLDATEACVPSAPTNFKAQSSFADKTLTLTWLNPTTDADGVALNTSLSIKLYEGGTLLTTLNDQQPGEAGSYTYSPAEFYGKRTYSAVAEIGGMASPTVVCTADLGDVQGKQTLVKAFEVNSKTKADWVIEGSGKAWAHDYANVFIYKFRQGNGDNSNEWLISPAVSLDAGKRYVMTYDLKTSRDYGNNLNVCIGEQQTADGMKVVQAYYGLCQNGFETYTTPQFFVENSGNHYVGFQCTNANYFVSMRNLCVYYVEGSENAITMQMVASEVAQVAIYSTDGKLLSTTATSTVAGAMRAMPKGTYVVRTTTASGATHTIKVMK